MSCPKFLSTPYGLLDINDVEHRQVDLVSAMTVKTPFTNVITVPTKVASKGYLDIPINNECETWLLTPGKIMMFGRIVEYPWCDSAMGCSDFYLKKQKAVMFLMGFYVGDGWCTLNHVHLACNERKGEKIIEQLKILDKFDDKVKVKKVSTNGFVIIIHSKWLHKVMQVFGKGASKKLIPQHIIDLDPMILGSFLDGLISSDGHIRDNGDVVISTVSKQLSLNYAMLILKCYQVPVSTYIEQPKEHVVINGVKTQGKLLYRIRYNRNYTFTIKSSTFTTPITKVINEYAGVCETINDNHPCIIDLVLHN